MPEPELLINPPQEVFDEIVYWTGESEQWAFQSNDYSFRKQSYDNYWLLTLVEKGTFKLIASLSLSQWDDDDDGPLYSIGMFYCKKEYRGNGYARELFCEVMRIIGDCNASLNSVASMSEKYANVFGFDKLSPDWIYSSSILMSDFFFVAASHFSTEFSEKDISEVDLSKLYSYDRRICGRNRERIMRNWFNMNNTFTKVVLDNTATVVAYCSIRILSKNRLSVAPLYADSLESAKIVFSCAIRSVPDYTRFEKITFLHPESNNNSLRFFQQFTKKEQVVSVRFVKTQFTKRFIETPSEKVFSISDCPHQYV